MRIQAREKKLHRVNSNGVLCDIQSLNKLRDGEIVQVAEEVANELLNMGVVKLVKETKKKSKEK
tara:strand:- start:348 stop:539 length:192 start_codon:yes stop_codon:yes gene_type:complete